ncbi:hypothetical protein BCR44DRAFT_1424294 [Catenaria anguillulae PL171]|uniref:Ankyrin repeat-containing domain protein n=1 Tax=Catenaria anguillulae PL171 TaxID=765915 RepID=A0A1Y2I2G2_9FUNG|nr:hypothetical protein BCR44DRAFT_1424294 [Catenaria anguillulae PL171]
MTPPPPPSLDVVPHIIECILTLAIHSVPRPITFSCATRFAAYLNVLGHDLIPAPSHAAIHRMHWINSTIGARLGDIWLLRELAKLDSLPDSSRLHRPIQYHPQSTALSVGALGSIDLIECLVAYSPNVLQGCLDHVICQASNHGHVHVLDWIANHSPQAFLSVYTPNHLAYLQPDDTSGERHIRTLEWWIQHPNLWQPRWLKLRPKWHVQALVHACTHRNMRVVEYWLSAQDYRLIHSNPDRLRQYLSWPLAAAAFTGDVAFFESIYALWPESMAPHVVALACASGNLKLAQRCHSLLRQTEFSKQDSDLCYLLATASAGFTHNDTAAMDTLNWLHDDLQLFMTGQANGSHPEKLRWITSDVPDWPITWDKPFYYCMHVATAIGSPALLDWWHVRLQRDPSKFFFRNPLQGSMCVVPRADAVATLQWWRDSGLISELYDDQHTFQTLIVPMWIERGASVEVFDWLLRHCELSANGPPYGHFATHMIDRACLAGQIDLLNWILSHLTKFPAPVYSANALDLAYRSGNVLALQWLKDEGFLDALRAQAASLRVPLEQSISFIARKWPECFECFEWAHANGFEMSQAMRKRAIDESLYSPVYVKLLLHSAEAVPSAE